MHLLSWIGGNDLEAAEANTDQQPGAIAATLASASFTELHLLYGYPEKRVTNYLSRLSSQYDLAVVKRIATLDSPIDFHDIYLAADELLAGVTLASSEPISVLLNSGTPAMQAVWILLGKTKYPVTFYRASPEQGVQQVDVPFEIAAEYVPRQDQQLLQLSTGQVNASAAFDDIVTQNPLMKTLKQQATQKAKPATVTNLHLASGRNQRNKTPTALIGCSR